MSPPDVNPQPWELAYRFDYSASLRFIGPTQDFHVVYETSREAAKRGAALPAEVPTTQETTDMGNRFFFRNWDLPRLKQVVSRDFIVNITPQGHYKNLVEIYRRPANAGAVDRTPGLVLEVGEAIPLRTLILENPDAANDPYPATPEKLLIVDGDTTYKIERTGYPAYAEKSPGSYGVSHPDLSFEIKEGETVRYSKSMDFQGIGHVITTATLEGVTSTETINDQDWSWYLGMVPSNQTLVRGSQTTTVINTHAANPSPWGSIFRHEWHPLTSQISITNEPNLNLTWNASGRLVSAIQGSWRTDYSIESNALKAVSKFSGATYATNWTEWSNHDRTIKTYTAPDGLVSSKDAAAANWTQIELGNASGTGLPGLPHKLTSKDGSGAKWTWTAANDFSGLLVYESGQLSGGNLTNGQKQTTTWNKRSYTITSLSESVIGGISTVVGSSTVPEEETTAWGAPKKWVDYHGLSTLISYDGQFNRATSVISPLGLTTNYSNYDIFYRPGQIESNDITANHTYTGLGVSTTYGGVGVSAGSQSSFSQNAEGTTSTTNVTWGGVTQSSAAVRGASNTTITGSHSLLGSSGATLRKDDGSLSTATGSTLAFGGVAGDALSVVDGLFVTKSAVAEAPGTFAATHSDAWGRVHKIVTPSKSSGTTQTTYAYSLPAATLKRVITTDTTGRKLITESDTEEMISRSGIDVDKNGSLDNSDRYTESTTEVVAGKIVTILKVTEDSGMREVLRSELTPATGVTVTKINGNEETITTTPNYSAKTITTASSKGWSRTTGVNSLGLATTNTLSGTGIPTISLTPSWRADGSLQNVSLNIGGETHSADFNENGTLATLTAPGRGNILGGHSITNGVELLTVNGKTVERKLDGTEKSTSGGNVIAKSEVLSKSGSGYKETVTPAVGAATETAYNAAFATTAKTYADSTGETLGYIGELLSSITLARGGALTLAYSNDGAKDLTAATWPAIASGPFTIPGIGHGFEYNRSGQIKTHIDPSGTRSLTYFKGRMNGSLYTAGVLKGYQVIPGRDEFGRQTGILLKRDGNTIHTTAKALNGASDQVTNLASGNITATPQQNAAGNITGYIWSDGTNTVTQTWTRGAGGRIEKAESDVAGAPSFDYLLDPNEPAESFDTFGRRLKSQTAGGTWTYTYGAGGQLTSATHPTLGTFNYAFDGIGRRTDKGNANTTDILNRTLAWTHNQNKTLSIKAHPDARVWFNGVEIENFNGTHNAAITPPGAEGGWVPWETLAIIEDAGEGAGNPAPNPLADPDAKSEKRGAVWVPPTAETFTFDAAGNRLSSAQWNYGWDAKNQLARVRTKNHTTAAQAYDLTFTYDSEGRRIKKHVIEYQNGAVVSEKIITFIWDGWDLLYERHQLPSGLTTLERKYLWGPDIADGAAGGAGGLLLIRETKGNATTNLIPLYDGTGHVVALTDINKNLLATYQYGPFGEKISATGSYANSNPWRYQTKYLDEETGLYYFGHRYYDPITGQWMSRELLGEGASINLYSLTHNDPINKVDRLGLDEVTVTDGNARYNFVDEVNGARGGWLKKSLDHLFHAKLDGSARKFTGSVALGPVSDGMVSFPCGASIPLSDLQTMADGRAMGTYSSDDQMRLLTGDINGWLARNEGAKGSKIVGAVDKIISSPFQAMAGPDALTILGGIADKHDGFSFGVDLGSRNYARGIHYGSEIDDGIQIASIPLLLNPKNATGLLRGVRALEVGGELSMFRRISGVRAALPAESRVFWSGGDPAREAAEAFAMRTSGATTLELSNPSLQTISETMLTQGKDWATVVRPTVWEPASEAFAEGASGTINVFQNAEGVSLRSVWREIEYPILKENPGIKIQYHVVMPDGTVISIQ
jgi:RHS repeat-associated protein